MANYKRGGNILNLYVIKKRVKFEGKLNYYFYLVTFGYSISAMTRLLKSLLFEMLGQFSYVRPMNWNSFNGIQQERPNSNQRRTL